MHRVDRAAARRGGDRREQGAGRDAEAHFLALQVGSGDTRRVEDRVARGLRPIERRYAGGEQHQHGGEYRPSLTRVAHRLAEGPGQPRTKYEDAYHLDEVCKRRMVLERTGAVSVEEAAAIGPLTS